MTIENIKQAIVTKIKDAINAAFGEEFESPQLDFPPDIALGDFAFGCFPLAKQCRKSPASIAESIADEIKQDDIIQGVSSVGPYVNFTINRTVFFGGVCEEIKTQGDDFGSSTLLEGQRAMVEYLSPNTNKPLHLGHVRNGALGMSVANLLEAAGAIVVRANLVNDRGVHICKSMLAWKRWANGATPESTGIKGDHFVGQWYIRYAKEVENDARLEEEVQEMLQKWEAGDSETIALWKMMNSWVYGGFARTYRKLGLVFDVFYHESETYKLGKDIVQAGLKKGVFSVIDGGAVVAELPIDEFGTNKDGSPKRTTVLRADGTSVYMTQDLGTAEVKFKDHDLTRSIYVVGSEQNYHFKVLFKLLHMLGFEWAKGCYHLSYGMVYLPEGKMKSREGKIVDADDLVAGMQELAAEEICKRDFDDKLTDEEIQNRAAKIAIGAINFYLLRVGPRQDIHFDPEESISFDGSTGPYCQYAYARAASILRNATEGIDNTPVDYSLLGEPEELYLLQKLLQLPEEIESAVNGLNPSRIATYIHEVAKAFNQFYQKHSVLQAGNAELVNARMALVQATMIVLKKGLGLLGIEVLEEM